MIIFKKISDIFSFMKPSKKVKHRTMVLVGSHGEVVSIRRFFGLAIVSVCVSIITIIAIIYLVFTGNRLKSENVELAETLSEFKQKVRYLKNENDILMTRLVAESEKGSGTFESNESQTDEPSNPRLSYEQRNSINIGEQINNAGDQMGEKRSAKQLIEVGNLVVTHVTDTKTLQVRFDLKNVDPDLNPVSGRTVVILKTGEQNQKNWLTLPFVPLVSGKPASTTTGRTFLISRFKTVKFSIAGQLNPNRYKTATVFVFSTSGDTLLEKDFTVTVKGVLASDIPHQS
jgi:Sec-independent protein translocase protein TatA